MAKKMDVSWYMLETNLARTQGKRASSSIFSNAKRRRPKRNLKPKDLEKIIDTTFTEEEWDGPGLFTQTGTPRYNLCMVDKGSDKQLQLRYGRVVRSCVDIENSGGDSSVQSDWNENNPLQPDFIKNKPTDLSDFNNDVWFITSAPVDSVNGQTGVVVLGKGDVGLSNVDNTSDINKPISTATQNALNLKVDTSSLSPVATSGDYNDLSNQPDLSGFDNIDFYNDLASFPAIGDSGDVLYMARDTGILYRWTWSAYAVTSGQMALGETSDTAYRGDRGKIAFDHTSSTNNPHNVTQAQVWLEFANNTSDLDKPISTATQTALNSKQDVLVSGTNIKTINGNSLLWAWDITIITPSVLKIASFSLALSDAEKMIRVNSASAVTVTVPNNATVAFPIDTQIDIVWYGAWVVSIAWDTGVTINSKGWNKTINWQYVWVTLKKISTNERLLIWDLKA